MQKLAATYRRIAIEGGPSFYNGSLAEDIMKDLNEKWWRVRIGFVALQGRVERSNPEHQAIVESVLAGDGDEAERLMQDHLNKVRKELLHVLANLVLPFVEEGV